MKKIETKKINCIIDCDPGVDDTVAIALSLYDSVMDIKLITTVNGNLDLYTVTRNVLHVLEKFDRTDIPVAKGAENPMGQSMPKPLKQNPLKRLQLKRCMKLLKNIQTILALSFLGHTQMLDN